MAEIISELDRTESGEDGWRVEYELRRRDGHLVTVQARADGTTEAVAEKVDDPETHQYIADRGRSAAEKFAERAQSPSRRGTVIVTLLIDPLSGLLTHDYHYERPPL